MTRGRAVRAGRPAAVQLELTDRGRPRMPRAFVRDVVREALAFVERPRMPVSLLLTDDAEIADLHAQWFDDPTPTDVISFPVDEGAELVVSTQTASRVAREHGHAVRAEVALYVVHGLLHCCGFDDLRAADRRRMRAAEREVMQRLRLRVHAVDA